MEKMNGIFTSRTLLLHYTGLDVNVLETHVISA